MTLDELNLQLSELGTHPSREAALQTARWLVQFMGLRFADGNKEKAILPNKQELKKYLVRNTLTNQGLLFRFTERQGPVKIILGVLKKIRKDQIAQIIDKENLICFQKDPPFIQGRPSANAYLVYFVTTESFDRLYIVLFNDNQKRIISLRNKLTPTQFNKIFPQWENIGQKSKPEIAAQLWKSLDLKEVNKEFYKQIKEQFDALVAMAVKQAPKAGEKDIKQFAVRLIGRYIFCWFLKEKGIIPDDLLGSAAVKGSVDYLKKILEPLFFKTLNTPVPERDFLKSADAVLQKLETIPYLNGGLFDKHPEDKLFSQLQLNDWLHSFVQVLENFDFTVDESSSQYQLVSIDPEMLGRIFENLLASQNEETEKLANQRKAYGAFYTQREIVDYMVNESLKAHLETHLLPADPKSESSNKLEEPAVAYRGTLFQQLEPQQILIPFSNKDKAEAADSALKRKNLKTKIDKLFAPGCSDNPFDKAETPAVRKLLGEVTVLDPACGSGAFPMGMMLRLMELRQIVGHGHRNNYDLKSEILSKNIYGVDIMSMAVEIARLRAWLSLVLEAEYKPQDKKNNFGIAALPNLDFKFICANSLIDSGYDAFLEKVQFNVTPYRMDGEIQKLERLREEYYGPKGDKTKKEALQQEFYKTKTYIKTEFDGLKKAWKLEDFLSKVDDWDPFDDSKPSSFFSPAWMFGIREGFDVVIGNPPYVDIKRIHPDIVKYFFRTYKTTQKRINLYSIFLERGYNLISAKGNVTFIIPNSILINESYLLIRKLIIRDLRMIIKLPDNVFEAIVETIIIQICRGNSQETVRAKYFENDVDVNFKQIEYNFHHMEDWRKSSDLRFNIFTNNSEESILDKIELSGKYLQEIADFSLGITPYDKYKGHTEKEIKNRVFHSKTPLDNSYVPLIGGKNIHSYYVSSEPLEEYLKYGPWLGAPRELKFFTQPRVIVRQIVSGKPDFKIYAGYTENELYFTQIGFGVVSKKNDIKETKIILALLNSSLIRFYHANKFIDKEKEVFLKILIANAKRFPFPNKIPPNSEMEIVKKIDAILKAKPLNHDITSLEKEIDVLVYKLYGLTEDEIAIVEKQKI